MPKSKWQHRIERMVQAKEALAVADTEHFFTKYPPNPPAKSAELQEVEDSLGVKLDPRHRKFLGNANGWLSLLHAIDIFSTAQIQGLDGELARERLHLLPDDLFEQLGYSRESLLVVAASQADIDLFVMPVEDGVVQPTVIWLAGEEIETYPSFKKFFDTMTWHNLQTIQDLEAV